jgi:hypothetical protein
MKTKAIVIAASTVLAILFIYGNREPVKIRNLRILNKKCEEFNKGVKSKFNSGEVYAVCRENLFVTIVGVVNDANEADYINRYASNVFGERVVLKYSVKNAISESGESILK